MSAAEVSEDPAWSVNYSDFLRLIEVIGSGDEVEALRLLEGSRIDSG